MFQELLNLFICSCTKHYSVVYFINIKEMDLLVGALFATFSAFLARALFVTGIHHHKYKYEEENWAGDGSSDSFWCLYETSWVHCRLNTMVD